METGKTDTGKGQGMVVLLFYLEEDVRGARSTDKGGQRRTVKVRKRGEVKRSGEGKEAVRLEDVRTMVLGVEFERKPRVKTKVNRIGKDIELLLLDVDFDFSMRSVSAIFRFCPSLSTFGVVHCLPLLSPIFRR